MENPEIFSEFHIFGAEMRNQRTLSAGCNLWDFDVSNATVKTASD
jgi:hypothetical protein